MADSVTKSLDVLNPVNNVAYVGYDNKKPQIDVTVHKLKDAKDDDPDSYYITWQVTQSPQGNVNKDYFGVGFYEGQSVRIDLRSMTNNQIGYLDLDVTVEDPDRQHRLIWTMYWQNEGDSTEAEIKVNSVNNATGEILIPKEKVRFVPTDKTQKDIILRDSNLLAKNNGPSIFSIGDLVSLPTSENRYKEIYKINRHGEKVQVSKPFVQNRVLQAYEDEGLQFKINDLKVIITVGYVSKRTNFADYYFFRMTVDPDNNGRSVEPNTIFYIPKLIAPEPIPPYTVKESTTEGYQLRAVTSNTSTVNLEANFLDRFDKCSDWAVYEGDEASNDDKPEHEISFINELTLYDKDTAPTYPKMAMAGLIINSSKEWTNFSQVSVYLQQGLGVEKLDGSAKIDDGKPRPYAKGETGPTNNFAEIVWGLLTNEDWGSGKRLGFLTAEKNGFILAAEWCRINSFTFDGVISNAVPLRQFIHEYASYMLLDFLVIGGQLSLVPSVPYGKGNSSDDKYLRFSPTDPWPVQVSGLFTDGNMSDYKVTAPNLQERQPTKISIKYRKENINGFPEDKVITVRLADDNGGSSDDPIESYDWTGFATNAAHCEKFAKFRLHMRKYSDHAISFLTSPQYVYGIQPSDYIKIVSKITHADRFKNGAITNEGEVITTSGDKPTTAEECFFYQTARPDLGLQTGEIDFAVDPIDAAHRGIIYTIKRTESSAAVYKVEAISYAEDGLVEVTASFFPVDSETFIPQIYSDWDASFDVEAP